MINITLSQKTYDQIKADVTKLVQRYVTVLDDAQLDHIPMKSEEKVTTVTTRLITEMPIHPVVAPAPVVAPTFPIVQSSNDELDVNGEAWDPAIHSAHKTKTAQGAWRARRNIDKDVKTPAAVVAAAVKTPATIVLAAPAPQPVVVPVVAAPQVVAPLPVAAPVKQVSNGHTLESFKANLVPVFADLIHQGKIDQAYVDTLKGYFKVNEIWQVMTDAEKVSELFENFCSAGLITRIL